MTAFVDMYVSMKVCEWGKIVCGCVRVCVCFQKESEQIEVIDSDAGKIGRVCGDVYVCCCHSHAYEQYMCWNGVGSIYFVQT